MRQFHKSQKMDVIFVGLKNNTFYKSLIISIIRFTYSLNSYNNSKDWSQIVTSYQQSRLHSDFLVNLLDADKLLVKPLHIAAYLAVGDAGVNLRRFYVCVSQHLGHRFNGYAL